MRRLVTLCVAICALFGTGASGADGGLPARIVLLPGRSLGGISLGETRSAVASALGRNFASCRSCPETTWLYEDRVRSYGLAVRFDLHGVAAIFTLGSTAPPESSVPASLGRTYPRFRRRSCGGELALVQQLRRAVTVVWGPGDYIIARPGEDACPAASAAPAPASPASSALLA
jgi:hypothetical protein